MKKHISPFLENVIEDVHGREVSIREIRRDILRELSKINFTIKLKQLLRKTHIFNRK
jgi:hypothetical protein